MKKKPISSIILAEFSIFPLREDHIAPFVREAYNAMLTVKDVKLYPGSMATVIEAPTIEKMWEVVQVAHKAMLSKNPKQIYFTLKVDDRHDRVRSATEKLDDMIK